MLKCTGLTKIYKPKKGKEVVALNKIDLDIEETGMVFILGKSGSGKSTLLNTLGGLDKYDEGEIIIKGKSSKDFSQAEFDSYRNTYLGFIFQEYNILNEFTVGANIALAMELQGKKATSEALNKLLDEVDLQGFANRKPNELSGGQKQRVAIARALIKDPEIIMADEPTGALDSNTGKQVFDTLQKLSKTKLVLIVSHDREFAEYYGDRVIELADGKIISDIVKCKEEAKKASEGVKIVDESILQIEKGYTLTSKDLELINDYLKKCKNDVIISSDSTSNESFKRIARIDSDGNKDSFKQTKDDELSLKDYDEKDFKLIKSKLPVKNAFKIGASSLKAKPIRLLFTIFLSVIAFCMFGLVDTVGAYDKTNTTTTSMIDSNINYSSFTKKINNGNYYTSSKLNDTDIEYIKENGNVSKIIPVYVESSKYGNYQIGNLDDTSLFPKNPITYYGQEISGFAEVTASDFSDFDFTIVAGSFPSTTSEVVIPEYIYEQFKICGWSNPTDSTTTSKINSETDLVGKKISIDRKYYTISGIVDTKLDDSKYKQYKETSTSTEQGLNTYIVAMELEAVIYQGPHAVCYVKQGFINDNLSQVVQDTYLCYGSSYGLNFTSGSGDNTVYMSMSSINKYSSSNTSLSNKYDITFLSSKNANNLLANDIIIDFNTALELYNATSAEYISLSTLTSNAYENYCAKTYLTNPDLFTSFIAYKKTSDSYFLDYSEYKATKTDSDAIYQLAYNYVVDNYPTNKSLFSEYISYMNDYDSSFQTESEFLQSNPKGDYVKDELAWNFASYYNSGTPSDYAGASYANFLANKENGYKALFANYLNDYYSSYMGNAQSNSCANVVYGGKCYNDFQSDAANKLILELSVTTFQPIHIVINDYNNGTDYTYNFNVAGIAFDKTNRSDSYTYSSGNSVMLTEAGIASLNVTLEQQSPYEFAFFKNPTSKSELKQIVAFSNKTYSDNTVMYELENSVSYLINQVDDYIQVLAQVFLIVGIIFVVFASFLMLNFIATSISYKKREIGILRAIGARSNDVFAIFFSESFIIAIINWLIASVATVIIVYYLNNVIRNQYNFPITILSIGIRQIGIILAVSLLVAFVASFFPVTKIAHKKPIDAIQNR